MNDYSSAIHYYTRSDSLSQDLLLGKRKNIFSKANTSSAVGLLKYAIKEGIVQV